MAADAQVWGPLAGLVGRWAGSGRGRSGESTVEREYRFVLGGRVLHGVSRSVYEPQERNPRGEVHEEWAFFTYDKGRGRLVLREFHVEGFVNQYVADDVTPTSIVLVTEQIENIPPGWRARVALTLSDADLHEVFDLAPPGAEFSVYSENRLVRVS